MTTYLYTAEHYHGTSIDRYRHRHGIQIVKTDETGTRRFFTDTKSPCRKIGCVADHYKSGPNKRGQEWLINTYDYAAKAAAEMTRKQTENLE